jgi:altronate dehydratase
MLAGRLNGKKVGRDQVNRFVALVHSEGCGVSSGEGQELLTRTLISYAQHPSVKAVMFLEHGCEKTHNEYIRSHLPPSSLNHAGFASIQLDGGIEQVLERAEQWFVRALQGLPKDDAPRVGLEELRLGLLAEGELPEVIAKALGQVTGWVVAAGGTVVIPEGDSLLQSLDFKDRTVRQVELHATLAYGQKAQQKGLHVMQCPTAQRLEILTGLGATGVEVMICHTDRNPVQAHPLIPVLQVTTNAKTARMCGDDLDLILDLDPKAWPDRLLDRIAETVSREYVPRLSGRDYTGFQITRGPFGISL